MESFTVAPSTQANADISCNQSTLLKTNEMVEALKTSALSVFNELVSHHVKGADLLQKGFTELCNISSQVADWYSVLQDLLKALAPFFGLIESWLESAYSHLVEVYNWAKAMWKKIFG